MNAPEHTRMMNVESNASSAQNAAGGIPYPLRVLVERRWQLLACLLIVCGVAFAATTLRKPHYEATARVQVVMDQPKITGLASYAGIGGDYFSTQCQLLRSRRVLSRAAANLTQVSSQWSPSEDALWQLEKQVKIEPVSGSRLIDIIGISKNSTEAAAIANQITAAFIETSVEARKASNQRLVACLHDKINQYKSEIETKQKEIQTYCEDHRISGSNPSLAAADSRLQTIESELTRSQMDRLALETRRDQLQNMLTSGHGLTEGEMTLPEIASDTIVGSLTQKIHALQQEESQLAQTYLPGHERLRSARMQIADLQGKLVDQKQKLMQSLFDELTEKYASAAKQEQALRTMLDREKETSIKLTASNQAYENLLLDLQKIQKFHDDCSYQLRQFELDEGLNDSPVVVVDAAQIPSLHAGLSRSRQAASILLLGLLFSVGFIFAVDRFSQPVEVASAPAAAMYIPVSIPMAAPGQPLWQTPASAAAPNTSPGFRSQNAASPKNKLHTIRLADGSLPDLAFAERCRIVHSDQSSPEADTFRSISAQLLSRFWKTRQSLVVTSRTEHTGKTVTASNLAFALAKTGRNVLLVDASAAADLARAFKISDDLPDLAQALSDASVLNHAYSDRDIASLHVLPWRSAGDWDSAQIAAFDAHAKQCFDWVIYDASVMTDSFTQNLLQASGKCLLVLNSEEAARADETAAEIEHLGALNLGVIVNALADGVTQPA